MFRLTFFLFLLALFGAGCASNSEYGMKGDPTMRMIDGSGGNLREEITSENERAAREGQEPILREDAVSH